MSRERRRWPFAARLLTVTALLTALLGAAVALLVVGRAQPVRAARLHTRTVSRALPPSESASPSRRLRAGAPIVPAGLSTSTGRHRPRRRWTPAERRAHARVRLAEAGSESTLSRQRRLARRAHRRHLRRHRRR